MSFKRFVLVAFVAVVVLVPATTASARHYPVPFRLSLVPLQKAQLGPAASSFALNYGSGPVPGGGIAQQILGAYTIPTVFPSILTGRVSGYTLDYGDPLTGSTGVMEIQTGVQKFKSAAYAKTGLKIWRYADAELNEFNSSVLSVTRKWLKSPVVGQKGVASLLTFAAANLNPIVRLDEQVTDGRFILTLTVTAGSERAAKDAAPGLLRALDKRLHRALAGKYVGTPVKLPYQREAGQAVGGPEFSAAALQLSDVGESYWQFDDRGYAWDSFALSRYAVIAGPAGPFNQVSQDLTWWPTATEATYANTYQGELLDGLFSLGGSLTPVDLSALSDPANAVLITQGGFSYAVINLTRGQAGNHILAIRDSAVTVSDVQALAQKAAVRLDAALP